MHTHVYARVRLAVDVRLPVDVRLERGLLAVTRILRGRSVCA